MLVDARLDRPDLHTVDADGVLEVGVAGEPGDDGGGGGDVACLDARRAQRSVLADDHGAGGVLGRLSVDRHRSDADSVRLEMREKKKQFKKPSRAVFEFSRQTFEF